MNVQDKYLYTGLFIDGVMNEKGVTFYYSFFRNLIGLLIQGITEVALSKGNSTVETVCIEIKEEIFTKVISKTELDTHIIRTEVT